MNIDKLVDLLEDKGFQDPRTGNLFFGAYIYTYDPKEEYTLQSDLKKLTQRLKRPNNFLDCLTIDIYEFFIEYLKSHRFGQFTFFEEAMEQEKENPEKACSRVPGDTGGASKTGVHGSETSRHAPGGLPQRQRSSEGG